MHAWHDVEAKCGNGTLVSAIIEIPMGSKIKYELHKKSGLLKVDRILYSSVHYPLNYGFIPRSYCDDKDPLDILVIGQEPVAPLSIMRTKVIGAMKMLDQGQMDDKIIAIHADDPEYEHYQSIDELSPYILKKIRQFFEIYKTLEEKSVVIDGFLGAEAANAIVEEAIKLYEQEKNTLTGYVQ